MSVYFAVARSTLCGIVSPICFAILGTISIPDHLIRPLKDSVWNCQPYLFGRLEVNDEFKLRCLLYGRSAGLAPFKILFHVNHRAPIEVDIVHPVRHQAALIDELPLEVNSRQQVKHS